MKQTEKIYRELLLGVLEKKTVFTQRELSDKCALSIGLVNKVIKRLQESGAVEIRPMQFRVLDPSKIAIEWATKRNINRDVSEKYCIDMSITDLEASLPFIFTAYSAWRLLTKSVPFDYNEVYVYVPKEQTNLFRIWLRDKPIGKGKENLFVIFSDDTHLIKNSKNKIAPLPQIFVDIYSLAGLASKYFIKEILEKYPIFELGIE